MGRQPIGPLEGAVGDRTEREKTTKTETCDNGAYRRQLRKRIQRKRNTRADEYERQKHGVDFPRFGDEFRCIVAPPGLDFEALYIFIFLQFKSSFVTCALLHC